MNMRGTAWKLIRNNWEIYLFIFPTVLLVSIFQYYPAASGIFHSFFRWNGADISEPVGFGNYIDLVKNSAFWNSFRVAFIIGIWNVVKMIPALAVAVAIHRCRSPRMRFFYRIMFVIPMVIPYLVIVLIWRSFFFEATSGYLNLFLKSSGLIHVLDYLGRHVLGLGDLFSPDRSPAWLGHPKLILTACIIWGFPWVGSFAVLTHLAKLQAIPKDIYEAAEIDGVNWWTKFTRVELPLITGSIYINLVFTIIGTIKDAGTVLALAGFEGGPGGVVTVPALFMLRKAFMDQRMGYACAVGIVLTMVVMLLQKLSNVGLQWNSLTLRTKRNVRILLLTLAGLLTLAERLTFVAAALFIVGLPYRYLFRRLALRDWLTRLPLLALGALWAGGKIDLEMLAQGHGVVAALFTVAMRMEGFLQLLLIFFGFPWQLVTAPVATLYLTFQEHRYRRFTQTLAERSRRVLERESSAVYRLARTLGQLLLRFSKHAFIWAVLAFAFLPLYLMVIVSLKSNPQFYEAPALLTHPVHWENWKVAWDLVTPTVANSIFISTSSTVLTLLFALGGAYFFARVRMPLSGFLWNAILVLMMMPAIANLVPLFRLLRDMNLLNTLTALILVGASGGQIFAIFVLRNFVADIPRDLYEAAEIDGANHFQQLRNVVLPLSGPILGTVGVMHFIGQWNDFVLPLIVMRDHARLPVMVQLLRMAGEYIKFWGPLMAGYAIASVPIIILFIFSMKLFVQGMTEGAVKG